MDLTIRRQLRDRWIALAVAAGFGAGLLAIAQACLLARCVSLVFLHGQGLPGVGHELAWLLAVMAARAGLSWAQETAGFRAAGRVKADVRGRLAAHLLALGPAFLRRERTGELITTAVEGVEALEPYVGQYVPQAALAGLVPLAVLVAVFSRDALSGVVLLLTGPLIPLFMVLIGKAAEAQTRRQWKTLGFLGAHFLDVLQGLTTLKLLGRSRRQSETIARASDQFRRATMAVLRTAFLSALALEMLATLSTAIVAVEVGLRVLYGRLGFESAFVVLVLAPEFTLPLRQLGAKFHAGQSGRAAAERVGALLGAGAPAGGAALAGSGALDGAAVALAGCSPPAVSLVGVRFAYEAGRPALDGATLEIPAGSQVALVGPTGSGKTTLAALLLRFIEPAEGEILVNGVPLAGLPPEEWRRQVAWVPQNPYLFNDTVAANLLMARPAATREEMLRAAQAAGADEFIRALPHGYDTCIGERGACLSAGQAQRIAVARAFLKDAPFLILDEATANLDPELEAQIQDALRRLAAGRTTLLIAHRLATARCADRIAVLDHGRVVETGTHEELLGRGGVYHRLIADCRLQIADCPNTQDPFAVRSFAPAPAEAGANERQPSSAGRQSAICNLQSAIPNLLLAACLAAATVLSSVGLMAASAYIIAEAARHPSMAVLAVPIVAVRFFGISRGVLRYAERLVAHDATFRLLARLRVWVYQQLEPLAPAGLARARGGDLLARVVGDVETLQHLFLRVLSPALAALLVVGPLWLFLRSYVPAVALAVLALMATAGILLPALFQALSRRAGRHVVETRADLQAALVDTLQGAPDLIALGRTGDQLALLAGLTQRLIARQGRLASLAGLHGALGGLLANLALWAALALAIPHVAAGRLDGVYLPVLALASLAGFEAVLALPGAFQHLESSLQSGRRLRALAELPVPVQAPARPAPLPDDATLTVSGLTFRYAPQDPPALEGVSLELRPGRRVAIVGPSGAGKSTLLSLLLRFLEVQEGEITLGGADVRSLDPEEVRRRIGAVPQQTHLFNAGIRENLLLARPGAGEEEMVAAARQAQIHDFICSLPEGYDTAVGEQGLTLSAGERQRLALARALLQDPPILLLDEPTANLDGDTERRVLQALLAGAGRRAMLVATHRLVGMEAMDEILVLRAGRVVERGRHEELLQAGGWYRRMWELRVVA